MEVAYCGFGTINEGPGHPQPVFRPIYSAHAGYAVAVEIGGKCESESLMCIGRTIRSLELPASSYAVFIPACLNSIIISTLSIFIGDRIYKSARKPYGALYMDQRNLKYLVSEK